MGNAGQVNYSAAKAGVVGFTKTLAKEWGGFKVNVNAVAFGFIETRLTASKEEGGKIEIEGKEIDLGIPEQMRALASAIIPLGRPATPEEAAVLPRSRGGITTWDNVVAACSPCNLRKGNLTMDERGCGPRRCVQPTVNHLHRNGRRFPQKLPARQLA